MSDLVANNLPALAMLLTFLTLFLILVIRMPASGLASMANSAGFVVLVTFSIFAMTLVLHLFEKQDWTADVLKVVVGVLVGVVATYKTPQGGSGSGSSASVEGSSFGDNARVAGRDINETIEKMEGEIKAIHDSVIEQNQYVDQLTSVTQHLSSAPPLREGRHLIVLTKGGGDDNLEDFLRRAADEADKRGRGWRLVSFVAPGYDRFIFYFATDETEESYAYSKQTRGDTRADFDAPSIRNLEVVWI